MISRRWEVHGWASCVLILARDQSVFSCSRVRWEAGMAGWTGGLGRGWGWSGKEEDIGGGETERERENWCMEGGTRVLWEMNSCLWVWLVYSRPATCLLHPNHILLLIQSPHALLFLSGFLFFFPPFTETLDLDFKPRVQLNPKIIPKMSCAL